MSLKNTVIIGAGISGLTTAHFLNKKGTELIVIEKSSEAGGCIETVKENGYLFDRGPNSALETSPAIAEMVADLILEDELVYANKSANKRYILRNNELHALPMSPPAFLKSELFSLKGKLRLMAEPFIGRSEDGYYQSIADFVKRRLGKEFLDYAINPFVAGVYAGNPEELSVKSAFPKLYALEENYGGLIVGTIKSMRERKKRAEKSKQSAKMLSFKNGMQVLPKKIAESLKGKVYFNSEVTSIEKLNSGYKVNFKQSGSVQSIECEKIISTVPAPVAAGLFGGFDPELSEHLLDIYYPAVWVLYLGYNKKDIGRPLDGFGFLIPSKENKSFLGAIWSSVIFPGRSVEDIATFTIFVGGARDPEVGKYDKDLLIEKVRSEFEPLMNISAKPVFISHRFWPKAIPQYNLGYIEHENYFDEFERKNPGIILSGNYRGGISVGDCIKNGEQIARNL